MAGGIYSGLGRGIQDALGIFLQMDQQGKAEKRQAMLDQRDAQRFSLEQSLAQEERARRQRESEFGERFKVLGQTPVGTMVDSTAQDEKLGLGHFFKPEMSPGVNLQTGIDINADGSTRSTGSQPFIDAAPTGRGEFVGFEDTRSRTAVEKLLADQAKSQATNQTRVATTAMTVAQRDRALQALNASRQQSRALQAQSLQLRAAGNTLAAERLDAQIQQMNEMNAYRAAALEGRNAGDDVLTRLLMGEDAPAPSAPPPSYTPKPIVRPGGSPNPADPMGLFGGR